MFKKITKVPFYIGKILSYEHPKEFYYIFKYVPFNKLLMAFIARLNRNRYCLKFKKNIPYYEINDFLDLLKYKQKRVSDGLYLWNYKGREFYADEIQFIGLYAEYLNQVFEDIYAFDWKGKTILDIGGFIGDSALYFFEQGANKVVIYEPLEKNMRALQYNLEPYKDRIELHQKALAKEDAPLTLSSEAPAGDLGFGSQEGRYQFQCEGISISTLLKAHSIDVIKMDCEGGERYLTEATPTELRSVPYWLIESHNLDLYTKVTNAFEKAGFVKLRDIVINSTVNLMHFSLLEAK